MVYITFNIYSVIYQHINFDCPNILVPVTIPMKTIQVDEFNSQQIVIGIDTRENKSIVVYNP